MLAELCAITGSSLRHGRANCNPELLRLLSLNLTKILPPRCRQDWSPILTRSRWTLSARGVIFGGMSCQVLIGIGSNLGDRVSHLHRAVTAVQEQCGTVVDVSSCYESEPVGGCADQRFLNAVLCCETSLVPQALWAQLQAIEAQLGRVRTQRWANRSIDLDILLWRDVDGMAASINLPDLQIPHPRMLFRDFVMQPAAQIAPHWRHPYHQQMLKQASTQATSIVRRLTLAL